jgi:hypothetical protein
MHGRSHRDLRVAAAATTMVLAGALAAVGTTAGPPARAAATLHVVDRARAAGIYRMANDQDSNSVVFDYDKDGISDLLLSRHQLYGTELFHGVAGGTFVLAKTLPVADRHGCDAADFNGDGWPDFFCAVGALHGTTDHKSNELWLQNPTTHDFAKAAGAWGAQDGAGRGRDVAAFDADDDGRIDLFVGNGYGNLYPSYDKLYLNRGGRFVEQVSAAINKPGGICVAPADYDADGDIDIYVCGTPNHLLRRNANGTYTDVGKALGLSPVSEQGRDGDWADLDRDGHLDLVQTLPHSLRIHYGTAAGTFTHPFVRTLQKGRNAAVVDVDLDGDLDVYVVNGRTADGSGNLPDFLMLDNGGGKAFTDFAGLPQAASGGGSNVAVIPRYLGRPALVVTNGDDGGTAFQGPRQLLVFSG